jgi:hypothetical protein
VHIAIANSDLHRGLAESFKSNAEQLKGNPVAGMAEQFGNLMLNGFKLKPGAGLYVVLICMGVAIVVTKSRVLSKFKLVATE